MNLHGFSQNDTEGYRKTWEQTSKTQSTSLIFLCMDLRPLCFTGEENIAYIEMKLTCACVQETMCDLHCLESDNSF